MTNVSRSSNINEQRADVWAFTYKHDNQKLIKKNEKNGKYLFIESMSKLERGIFPKGHI